MRRAFALAGAVLVGVALAAGAQPAEGAIPARILRWYDGDTVQVSFTAQVPPGVGRSEVVRILGINAPEVGGPSAEEKRLAAEATGYLLSLTMGKPVYVELSPWERRDLHSRLLAHLWVEGEEGWVLVSEAMLRAGLARLLVYYPEREIHYCRLLHALALAQRDKRGLWGKFPEAVALAEVEADPVQYVTEAVTVVFTVASVAEGPTGLSLWAAASRYGFRAVLDLGTCPGAWAGVEVAPGALVGRTVAVAGELLWDSFGGGPRIVVRFPAQLEVRE